MLIQRPPCSFLVCFRSEGAGSWGLVVVGQNTGIDFCWRCFFLLSVRDKIGVLSARVAFFVCASRDIIVVDWDIFFIPSN